MQPVAFSSDQILKYLCKHGYEYWDDHVMRLRRSWDWEDHEIKEDHEIYEDHDIWDTRAQFMPVLNQTAC